MKVGAETPRFGDLRCCPLCGQILQHWRLHTHIHSEHWRMRKDIIVEIQNERPDWFEDAGACRRCWESYRGVARVVRFVKKFKFQKHWRKPIEPATTCL